MQHGEFTTRLMNDMDPQLLNFIKTKVNSFIKWDLLQFFHDNPNTVDTAESIARYVGRNVAAVKEEIQQLVRSGLLESRDMDGLSVYALAQNAETRNLLERFFRACQGRSFRVKVVYHIISSMH